MSGTLIKRPPAGSVVSYSKARWFVLGHDGTLMYLTKEGGAKKGDVERFEQGLYFIEEPRDDPESMRRTSSARSASDDLVFILSPVPPAQQKHIELQRMQQQGRAAGKPSRGATLSRKYVLEAENAEELIYWKQALANFCTAPEYIAPPTRTAAAHTVAGGRQQGLPQRAASQAVRQNHAATAHGGTSSARTVPKTWKKTGQASPAAGRGRLSGSGL